MSKKNDGYGPSVSSSVSKDGAPAFPSKMVFDGEAHYLEGMSLLDWFAGEEKSDPTPAFAQRFFGGTRPPSGEANPQIWIACRAAWKYAIANAMLAERNQKHESPDAAAER